MNFLIIVITKCTKNSWLNVYQCYKLKLCFPKLINITKYTDSDIFRNGSNGFAINLLKINENDKF
jgi:hypothetical protein